MASRLVRMLSSSSDFEVVAKTMKEFFTDDRDYGLEDPNSDFCLNLAICLHFDEMLMSSQMSPFEWSVLKTAQSNS